MSLEGDFAALPAAAAGLAAAGGGGVFFLGGAASRAGVRSRDFSVFGRCDREFR